ncbi:unnamed protein product [Phyllotreta striolata]|uniref:Uncharacterized protein n=1 Tax=Phyllotreta striolata TaxID=444603 RepID=A0A9N9TU59_PHYSR|nr:unnamed protein product [Phyllotreta striolata]
MSGNTVHNFIHQQMGNSLWKHSDIPIRRLQSRKENCFSYLLPDFDGLEGFLRDTPIFTCKFNPKLSNEHILALANEDGKLVVHNCRDRSRYGIRAHNNAIFDLAWTSDASNIITASGDHTTKLYDVQSGELRPISTFCGHSRSIKTVAAEPDDPAVFATGGRDGTIIVWDRRFNQTGRSVDLPFGSINHCEDASRCFSRSDKVIIDNSHAVKMFKSNKSKCNKTNKINAFYGTESNSFDPNESQSSPTCSRFNSNESQSSGNHSGNELNGSPRSINSRRRNSKKTWTYSSAKSVTGLAFQSSNTLISCGAGDGAIKIWDLRKHYNIYQKQPKPKRVLPYPGNSAKNGYSNLFFDNDRLKLYANCLDNVIYCYNINNYDDIPISTYTGHSNTTFYIKSGISSDGKYLISGSSDDNAYIWNTDFTEPFVKLTGHTAEVTSVAWSCGQNFIATCSDDTTHKIWTVENENWETNDGGGIVDILKPNNSRTGFKQTRRVCPDVEVIKFHTHHLKRITEEPEEVPHKIMKTCNSLPNSKDLSHGIDDLLGEGPPSKMARLQISSPVGNLPNYVLDGTAPHLNHSPEKRKSKDWLTRLRLERSLKRRFNEMCDAGNEVSPKKIRIEEKKNSTTNSPILKYFKIKNGCQKCNERYSK